jgi:hypothetical protein
MKAYLAGWSRLDQLACRGRRKRVVFERNTKPQAVNELARVKLRLSHPGARAVRGGSYQRGTDLRLVRILGLAPNLLFAGPT